MRILCLHGFLGQGRDWDQLHAAVGEGEWIKPNLFSPKSKYALESFAAFSEEFKFQKFDLILGYSFGGRLAMEIMRRHPEVAGHALILSANLGGLTNDEKLRRQQNDFKWAQRFLEGDWQSVVREWNAQDIFQNDEPISPNADHFDRKRLALALTRLSVTEQQPFANGNGLTFAVGASDEKYVQMYSVLEEYHTLPGGHRLLCNPSAALIRLVSDLVKPVKMY